MRKSATLFTALALAAPAVGLTLLASAPAAADATAETVTVPATAPAVVATGADLRITGSYNTYVRRGGKITYKLKVSNRGPYSARGVVLNVFFPKNTYGHTYRGLPRGMKCVYVSRGAKCTVGSLRAHRTLTVTLTAKVNRKASGNLKGEFYLTSKSYDHKTGNNYGSAKTKVIR
ncbi:hypothetical protein [Rhizohabitans arisaemae]|uniref:hypothetical protein n=1 Tax=Rhizohabitans arisaemae TaxID=2720610 RepID=UPI0024B09223|nr:hypothetical protein [Rhizohabitans arisaemae]